MSGLDLKSLLHLTPDETAALFRKTKGWVFKQSRPGGLLERAVRRYGRGTTLYFKPELERLIESPPLIKRKPWSAETRKKHEEARLRRAETKREDAAGTA